MTNVFSFHSSCNGACEKAGLRVENTQKQTNKTNKLGPCCLYLWMVLWRIHLCLDMGPLGGATSLQKGQILFPININQCSG